MPKFTINVYADNASGRFANLRLRLRAFGMSVSVGLGVSVTLDKYSVSAQKCLPNTSHGKQKTPASVINRKIENAVALCHKTLLDWSVSDYAPTKAELRNLALYAIGREMVSSDSLLTLVQEYAETKTITANTKKSYQTLLAVLKTFVECGGNITAQTFDYIKFRDYLISKGYENSSINVLCTNTVNVLRANGFEVKPPPKLKTLSRPVVFLTEDELRAFEAVDDTTLAPYRDIFVFACYTGLRVSDLQKISEANICDGRLTLTIQKTGKRVSFPLASKALTIWQKYGGKLPCINFSAYNAKIKDIGRLAKIDTPVTIPRITGAVRSDVSLPKHELLSSHTARKTFCCRLLTLGVSSEQIIKLTGHSSVIAMRPYSDIADNAVDDIIKLLQ